jgi:outer membrane protein TolC
VAQWELLDLGRHAARSAAGFEVERTRVARQDLADRIAVEVRTAHEAAMVARAEIAAADTRREASRRTFELVRRRYEEGAASSLELVDARTSFTAAELNRVLTTYRYAIRRVDLERAAALRQLPLDQERSER